MKKAISGLVTEDWLRACPTGILVRNEEGPLWANPALTQLLEISPDALERQLTSPPLQNLLEGDGLLRVHLADGSERWVDCTRTLVSAPGGGTLELRFCRDATGEVEGNRQREELARQVQELNLTDPLTGLANRRALGQALATQVTRSRRYRNPLSVALVRLEVEQSAAPVPDAVLLGVSRFLRERLRWADIIGREETDCFLLILPETSLEDATALMAAIEEEAGQMQLPPPHESLQLRLAVGVRQWRKGMDGARLVAEARRAVDGKASPEHDPGG